MSTDNSDQHGEQRLGGHRQHEQGLDADQKADQHADDHDIRLKLRKSEERLKMAMAVANDGLWDWNIRDDRVYFDPRYFTMAGYEPDEFPHTFEEWARRVHPDDIADARRTIDDHLNGRTSRFDVEFRFLRKDGSWMWTRGRGKIFDWDDAGRPARMVGTHKDITARKLIEQRIMAGKDRALRQREAIALLATSKALNSGDILQTAREITKIAARAMEVERAGVWLFDDERQESHPVALYRRSTGEYSAGDVLLAKDYPRYFQAIFSESRISAEDARTDPRTSEYTEGYLIPHGIMSMLDASIVLSGELMGVICLEHVDEKREWHSDEEAFVSTLASLMAQCLANYSQKKAEEEVRDREENLRVTLDSIGDAVIATDVLGKVIRMNPVAERLTGWSANEASGKLLDRVFHIINALTREPAENPVQKVMSSGKIVGLANHTALVSRDGQEYQISDSGAPIRAREGEIIGVVVVFRDVTREYALQEQLGQSQKLDAIGKLAGGVAHDFNNMLGGIMGGAELLQRSLADKPDNHKCWKHLDMIMDSARRAADLSSKLLTFARQQNITTKPVNVHDSIRDAVDILFNTIDKRIRISMRLDAQDSTVIGDAVQLQSVFLNLGINAAHSMPEGGLLSLVSREVEPGDSSCNGERYNLPAGRYIEIRVDDTGEGISPEVLPYIFDPFFTTKGQGEGTGLGLAAAYGTIQQHQGAITVQSEVGRGSSFCLLLPLAKAQVEVDRSRLDAVQGGGLVLVVDDEPVMRETARELLKGYGYQVISAENGAEAVRIFRRQHEDIALVILDMIMPEMNGRDCFYELRKIDARVPVILSSGYTGRQEVEKLMEDGLAGFIQKPFAGAKLSQLINRSIPKGS